MSERTARKLAWSLAALAMLVVAGTVWLIVLNRSLYERFSDLPIIELIVPIGFGLVGAVVASRRPENPIGWLFLVIAVLGGVTGISLGYALRDLGTGPGLLPATPWLGWLENWVISPIFPTGAAMFLFLLYPTGRFASPRWRFVGWAGIAVAAVATFLSMFEPTITLFSDTKNPLEVDNPIGVEAIGGIWEGPLGGVVWLGGIGLLFIAVISLVFRLRRSTGVERQQLKWFASAAFLTVGLLVVSSLTFVAGIRLPDEVYDLNIALGFGVAVPVACGVAIMRHGLYEIDVVINKAVVYTVLAAAFTALYVAIVIGIGTAVGSRSNSFLTVAAAVIIAVAFNPIRERARRLANRLVYGKRATPYDVLSEFSGRMAGTYATEDVLPRMARIMAEGTGARRAEVWLKVGPELRRAATWPDEAEALTIPAGDDAVPRIPGADRSAPVRHQGELLGALSVAKAAGDPVSPVEDKLVTDLAAQAGLVLRNVRLIEDLRASRQRIVAAQDEERRRLERNIHDGAQQQLVALSVKLGLLKALATKDPAQTVELAEQLQRESTDALENLRELARGIYPPLLADQGLVAALDAQARRAAIPVEIAAERMDRYPQEIEAAVYFSALEALQNVAKYAEATKAELRLEATNGSLTFSITDDGRGFDPATTPRGMGLQGMTDRLAALGGRLEVRSAPGSGTTVSGTVPVA
jgi:signal transduction histidine kinase